MSELLRAEHRRRQARAVASTRSTEQERFAWFLARAGPEVATLLHETGRAWGAVDFEQFALPQRSLGARLLGAAPPGVIGKGYRVTILDGPGCQGERFCLALGWIVRENGRVGLDDRPGLEAGGLSITVGYEDHTGGCFTLSATRPNLPAYYRIFYTLAALRMALVYEWERGTFVGPYAPCIPFHLHADALPAAR